MSELGDQLRAEVKRIIDEPDGPIPEFPIGPPGIETEDIFEFEPVSTDNPPVPIDDPFEDNPMKMLRGIMGDLRDMALNRPSPVVVAPPPSEHEIRIFRFNDKTPLAVVEAEIERLLNDGYRCHIPAACGEFLIMDFARIKETEENGKQ